MLALLGNVEIFVCGRGRGRFDCVVSQMSCGILEEKRTLALGVSRTRLAFAPLVALTVTTLTVATVVLTVADILHLAVAVNRAPGPVAVAALVVALTVLAGRAATLAAGRDAATTGRTVTAGWDAAVVTARAAVATVAAALTTGAVTAGVEAP